MKRIGVLSDTHGLLRPEVLKRLEGCDLIIHAGDVGRQEILEQLKALAPTHAVRGNVDNEAWCYRMPLSEMLQVEAVSIYLYHGHLPLEIDPRSAGVQVVISGHTHEPLLQERQGLTYLNPGSAGPRRFRLPVSMATLVIEGATAKATLHTLEVGR